MPISESLMLAMNWRRKSQLPNNSPHHPHHHRDEHDRLDEGEAVVGERVGGSGLECHGGSVYSCSSRDAYNGGVGVPGLKWLWGILQAASLLGDRSRGAALQASG